MLENQGEKKKKHKLVRELEISVFFFLFEVVKTKERV